MGFFGKLIKGALDTVLIPVDIARDVVTGDWINDDGGNTVKRIKKVVEDVEEAGEDAADGDFL